MVRLLDLPDEVISMLERRELSEGHGRALLLAPDHEMRRKLAAEAVRRSWSVRALETAARAAAGRREPTPTRRRAGTPAWLDAAAADDLVDAAFAALGLPARIATEGENVRSSCAYGMRASLRGSAMRSGPLVCSELARAISSVG